MSNPGELVSILRGYDEWKEEREALSARDNSDDIPRADDWYASDDGAVELLEALVRVLREA